MLVAALLWWLGLPFLFPVTSQAVINARTVPVRTPIDGSCLELDRDIGDTLVKGEPLMRVSCCRIDTSHLAELKTHNAELTAHRTRLLTERAASLRSLETSREAKIKYGEAIFVNLRTSIDEGVARAASRLVQSKAAQKRLDRQLARIAHRGIIAVVYITFRTPWLSAGFARFGPQLTGCCPAAVSARFFSPRRAPSPATATAAVFLVPGPYPTGTATAAASPRHRAT